MAIICPQCGAGYDVTLFEYGHTVRCECGRLLAYPGEDLLSGHVRDPARLEEEANRPEPPRDEETGE